MFRTTAKTIIISCLLLTSLGSYLFLNYQSTNQTLPTVDTTIEVELEEEMESESSSVLPDAAILMKILEKGKKIVPSS